MDYIKEVVLPSLKKHHDEHLLRQLKLRWDNHKVGKQTIGRGQAWRRKRQGSCPRCGRVHGIARRTSLVCAWTTAWCALEGGCDTCALPATEHGSHQAAAPSCSLSQLRHRVHIGHDISAAPQIMVRWLSRFFNYLDRYYIQVSSCFVLTCVYTSARTTMMRCRAVCVAASPAALLQRHVSQSALPTHAAQVVCD